MSKTIVQEALNHLVGDLRATHGDNLASVVLYGSAAAGDHIELRSDYNLLIACAGSRRKICGWHRRLCANGSVSGIPCRSISRSRNYRCRRRISD